MPDEVLGEIFEIYVLTLEKSPWNLTKVSRRFRKVAFDTRRLRGSVSIDSLMTYPLVDLGKNLHMGTIASVRPEEEVR
jgi:hypothetical protein